MGKGTIGINPFHTDRSLMSPVAVAGLLATVVAFTDSKGCKGVTPLWITGHDRTDDAMIWSSHSRLISLDALLHRHGYVSCTHLSFTVSIRWARTDHDDDYSGSWSRSTRKEIFCPLRFEWVKWVSTFSSLSFVTELIETINKKAVDVVGQAGKPRTISGFQTHQTPVRLGQTERSELATEEYMSYSHVLEGYVVLSKNKGFEAEDHKEVKMEE